MKQLWDKLAKENSKYYINSDKGKGISEDEFWESGQEDYKKLILNDNVLNVAEHFREHFLEIGCGTGRMTLYISTDFEKVTGIDISGEMIKEAKKRLKDTNMVGIELIETDGFNIPLADNSIDIAFSYLVFQHFKTEEMIYSNFDEVYRVLKPKGIFKVRVRTDKVDTNKWWGGVSCDETYPLSIGFKLLKKEPVEDYGLWLWLQK